jgi:hypothetical protein
MNATEAIQVRLDRAAQMDEWGRLPRAKRRTKKMPPLYLPPIYPEGVTISSPYAVSWGEVEAVSWGESPLLKFKHELVLGKHESHNPWGQPRPWLEVPDVLWHQVAKREGSDQWFPKMGAAGSLTAIVWCQIHGTIGDHPDHWVAHDVTQVDVAPSDNRRDAAREELFDKLYSYRADGVGIDCLISAAQEDEQGDRIEFYGTYYGSSVEDALRRASEAHPTATVTIAPPVCCDEF